MSPPCFYQPNFKLECLSPDAARHVVSALRMQVGDEIVLRDGIGNSQAAVISLIKGTAVQWRSIGSVEHHDRADVGVQIIIGQLRHPDRMEWLVEKCQELGVECLTVFKGAYSQKGILRMDRLQNLAIAALQQSQSYYLMEIKYEESLGKALSGEPPGQIVFGYKGPLVTSRPIGQVAFGNLNQGGSSCLVGVIGPEGDFNHQEIEVLLKVGGMPVLLGQSRLRAETAGLALASYLRLWFD